MIFILYFIANFAHMMLTPIMFSMVADTVDYGVQKFGKRLTAITFSGHLLAIKFGFAIGGALAGWILSIYHYVPNQEQTHETLNGILLAFAGIPIICMIISLVLTRKYLLTEKEVERIQASINI
jgi:GPH family glycoside/pentoside/hexuronide:cation symporter